MKTTITLELDLHELSVLEDAIRWKLIEEERWMIETKGKTDETSTLIFECSSTDVKILNQINTQIQSKISI